MSKKQICIWATSEETILLEKLKEFYKRNTYSDLLRFLINQAGEKILNSISSNEDVLSAAETKK